MPILVTVHSGCVAFFCGITRAEKTEEVSATTSEGRYTPGEIDRKWSEKMEKEFDRWKKKANIEELFADL